MIDRNDPRLTAYALGELDAAAAAAVEADMGDSPDTRAEVQGIRDTAALLQQALAAEGAPTLTDPQRQAIRTTAAKGPRATRFSPLRLLAWASVAAAACLVVGLLAMPALREASSRRQPVVSCAVPPTASAEAPESTAPVLGEDVALTAAGARRPAPPPSPAAAPAARGTATAVLLSEEARDELVVAPAEPAHRRALGQPAAAPAAAPALAATEPAPEAARTAMPRPGRVAKTAAGAGATVTRSQTLDTRGEDRAIALGGAAGPGMAGGAMGMGAPAAAPAAPAPTLGDLDELRTQGQQPPPAPGALAGPGGGAAPGGMAGPALATVANQAQGLGTMPGGALAGGQRGTHFLSPVAAPVSALPAAADATAYRTVRSYLLQGQLPPREEVRIGGLVNNFRYQAGRAQTGSPLSVATEVTACPWWPEQRLVRIAVTPTQGPVLVQSAAGAVGMPAVAQTAAELRQAVGVAWDVTVEVEPAPDRVDAYRPIEVEDGDTTVAEAEPAEPLREGQVLNAFYQVVPTAPSMAVDRAKAAATVPATRAGQPALDAAAAGPRLMTVRLHWRRPDQPAPGVAEVSVGDQPLPWQQASPDMQFGGAVALFGMVLRNSPYARGATFDTVLELAGTPAAQAQDADRAEFLDLVRRAKSAQAAQTPR